MSKPDPALDAIREARKQISHAFDNDPKRLVEHYMKTQAKFADRMISAEKGEKMAGEETPDTIPIESRP